MFLIVVGLALCDVGFCTMALPKIIPWYWFNVGGISFHLCFLQRQLIHYFGTVSSLMALDRYVAICFPLRNPMLMTNKTMGLLTGFTWSTAMISPGISTIMFSQMPFCGPNQMLNCYCDTISLNGLACADISSYQSLSFSLAMVVLLLPFSLFVLCIIGLYYMPRCVMYLMTYASNVKVNAHIAPTMFYSFMPPVVNPLIYCFRTKEIRKLLRKWLQKRKVSILKSRVDAVCG
ncbi:olfactory receptor 2AT4-like [Arapaima gigas]